MNAPRALRLAALLLGLLAALLAWAPASWLAAAVERGDAQHVLLRDTDGNWHAGSARLLLANPGSGAPPQLVGGRLHWRIDLGRLWRAELPLQLQWDGVSAQPLQLMLALRGGGWMVSQPQSWQAELPAQILQGLGAPWNTVALRGQLRLSLQRLQLRGQRGGVALAGTLQCDLIDAASRLSPLPRLGSYRLLARSDAAGAALSVDTLDGPLWLQGRGSWGADGLHFNGHARADASAGDALDALLALLGPRQGDGVALRI